MKKGTEGTTTTNTATATTTFTTTTVTTTTTATTTTTTTTITTTTNTITKTTITITTRMKTKFEEKKRINDAKEQKMKEDLAILETKNALKCNFEFTPEDQESTLLKLRTSARLYDKSAPGAMSLRSFEVLHMEPHVFKEQLKRVFNLKVTPGELGVLMSIYDPNNEGKIVCADFTQNFLALGYSERERELRESLENQRKAEELRKLEEDRKKKELESKHAQKFSFEYSQEDYDRAMIKLIDASCKFDKSGPGVPNLTAFESRLMEPVVFKEQLKRAFNMNLTPPELGAIIKYYHPDDEGNIVCKDFLNRFTRMGIEERAKQRVEYLKKEAEIAEIREREAAAKAEEQAKKILLQTSSFTEDHFKSALTKLTKAAFKFEKVLLLLLLILLILLLKLLLILLILLLILLILLLILISIIT
jgi:hypothetical protein